MQYPSICLEKAGSWERGGGGGMCEVVSHHKDFRALDACLVLGNILKTVHCHKDGFLHTVGHNLCTQQKHERTCTLEYCAKS